MVFEYSNYKTFLKSTYLDKSKRNQGYSLRAFANQLGVAHSTLSEIFGGKKNLSVERASEVAFNLGLKGKEVDYFCLLVQKATAKKTQVQSALQERLHALNPKHKIFDLHVDAFKMISDWAGLAILTLCDLDHFNLTPESASKKLKITKLEAEFAIDRLVRLELLEEKEKKYIKVKDSVLIQAAIPNEGLKNFHRQYLDKAKESITTQTPQERLSRTENIAIDPAQLKDFDALMDEFSEKLNQLAEKSKKKTHVYNLSCHFFNLTPTGGKS